MTKRNAKGQFLLPKEKGIGEIFPEGNLVLFSHRDFPIEKS
jgi:hypothetical protein